MEVDNFPEVSSTPPQQSPLGSCKVNSSERLIDKLETPESLSLSKNFRTESHEMNVENSNEVSFDKSIKRTLVKASIELGLQIEGLLNSSAEKQLQNDSNKENEKYDVSPVVTATIQEVPTTVMTSNNRKSLSPVLVEKAEQIKQVLSSDQMPSKVSPIKESLTMTSLSANTEGLNDLEDTSPVSDSKADDSIIVIEDTEITEIDKVEKQNDINRASDNLITKEIVIRLNRTKVHRKASSEEMSIFDRDKSKASKDAIMSDDSKDSNPEILEVSHNLENVTSFTDKLLQSEKSNEHENRTSRLMTENNDSPSKWMSPVVENKPHTNIDRNSINKEDVISSKESLEKDISRSADTTLFVEVTASSMNIPVENNFDEESTSGQSKEVSVSEDQSKKVATSVNTEVQHRGAVQKPKSEKNQTRSQKRHDEDDSDSDMNLENLFHDIPANEWNRKFTGSSPTVENESEAECDLVLEDKEETAAEEVTKNGSNSGNTLSFKKSEVKAKKGNETKTGDEEENKEMDVESDVENKVCEETAVRKSLQSNQQLLGLVVDKNVKKSDSFRKSVDNSENDVSSTAYCKSTGKSESTTNVQKDVHSSVDESSKSSLETSTSSKSRSQKKRKSTENSSEKNINVSNDLNNLNTSKASNKSKILESEEDNANFDDEEAVATQTNVSFEKSNKSRKSAENQQVSRQSLNKSNQEHGSSFIAVTKSNNSFNETNSSNSSEKIPTSPISGNKKSSKKREESVKEKARFSVTSTQGEMEPEHMDTDEDEEEEEPWKNSSNNIDIRRSESGASGKRSKRASLVVEEDESLFVSGKQIKAVSQKYGEYNTVNENYSIAAQVDSESSNDSLEDSKEQWVPQFLFGSSNGEEDGSSNGSIDSDIAREYNLDGKSDVEDPDEDIPGDVCRESEVENSDSDDNGSDLEGFVVYDEEEDEEDEDESAEEDTSRGKGKKKFSRIAVQFSDEEEEESDNEVNPKVIKTSVGDESNVLKFTEKLRDNIETVKTPKRGKVPQNLSETDKSRGVSDEQNADKSFKTPKVSSTPKLSGKTLKNKIVSNINLGINKGESSNCSKSDEESLTPAFMKKKNMILNQVHTIPSVKSAMSFCETSGTKQIDSGVLQKSLPALPTDLTDVTETNLSRQKSSKVSMLNKTMLTPSSETTVTKFLKKQRLHDTLPSVDLQEQAEGILDEAKEIVESSKEAHLTSKMSTLDKSRKDHIHTRIKEKSNEEDTKILVEQEEMTPTENTTKLKNSEVNKKASKKLKNEQKTIFEAEEAVDKPTKGEKKKKKKKKLSDQGQETENPEKSKTKNNLKAQDKLEATDEAEHVTETMVTKKQKKKKRQSAQMIPTENIEKMDDKPAKKVAEKRKETENLDENSTQRPSKKRKKVESTEFGATSEEKLNSKKLAKDIEVDSGTKQKLKKKSKKSPAEQVEQEAIKMADKDTNKESAGRARKKIKSEGSDLQNSEDQPTTSSKLTSKKKKVRAEIINPEDQPVKISKLTSKKSTATSDSDEAPEAVDFSKARAEALRAMKNAVDSIKAGRETKRKERREQLERIHQKKSAKLEAESAKLESESRPRNSGLKRLPDEVVENLSDSSMKRSKRKRRKLSKTDEMVPPKSLFVPDRASNAANNAEDGFIPLSAAGSTTEFSVVKLTKIKKRTSSTAASFRQQKLARNNRQPSTSYTTYRQKLKASGKDKLPH
ncbi:transcriptional regulator ATRX isoform X2 [Orussus abietinus]|uniref:transcriptional regulator ATRX isoform X2 n=1 Tax=Orussus abietinus TaxID=222816 RepID=UPI00062607A7|nr:transcriptional regulator ATRX isoform X2 [Orussus abietinus]